MSSHEHYDTGALEAIQKKVAKATSQMARITKSKTADTGSYKYKYATLTDTLETVKDALHDQGLVVMQPIVVEDNTLMVTTSIIDIDTGGSINFGGPGIPLKGDPQAMGSAISYYRRYALTSLFALEVDDDDGGTAHRQATRPQERTPAEAQIRKLMSTMQDDEKAEFAADFKGEFHSTLTNLPESKHGEALKFTKFWIAVDPPAESDDSGVDEPKGGA